MSEEDFNKDAEVYENVDDNAELLDSGEQVVRHSDGRNFRCDAPVFCLCI